MSTPGGLLTRDNGTSLAKRALITGVTGQDGSYLAELLLDKGYEVHGLIRRVSQPSFANLAAVLDRIALHTGDMTDGASLFRIIATIRPDEIYNLAAMSHVRDSYDHPEVTQDINAGGLLRIMENCRTLGVDAKIYQACHDEETRAVTPSGFKSYMEICKGDLVYTVNEKTHAFELKPVEEVISYDYAGVMIEIEGRRISQKVTPNHRVILEHDTGKFDSAAASELSAFLMSGRSSGHARKSFHSLPLRTQAPGRSIEAIVFSDFVSLTKGNCYRNYLASMGAPDFCYLLGLYIGDGYTQARRPAKVKYVSQASAPKSTTTGRFVGSQALSEIEREYDSNYVFFAVPIYDKARPRLIATLDRCGIHYNAHEKTVEFASQPLARMFKLAGDGVYSKAIPNFVFDLSADLQQHVLNGLIDSDGHARGKRASYTTVSEKLVVDLIRLCSNLGKFCSVATMAPREATMIRGGRVIQSGPIYNINIAEKITNKVYPHQIRDVPFSGKVWCLKVRDNHNFMICRNGKLAFSGNCSSEMFGKVRETPQTELTAFHPRSPYGASKVAAFNLAKVWREAYGTRVSCGILFNHESERRGEAFLSRKVCKAAAEIAVGRRDRLTLGNLDAKRDWGYAKEYVAWIHAILQHPIPDDFVIATGETHSVREFVAAAFACAGIPDWERYVEYDRDLTRPAEVDLLCGDASKSKRILGFEPKVKFAELVNIMVDAELAKVRPAHSDERRDLYSFPEAKLIEIKTDTVVGRHYHMRKEEKFILSEGEGLLHLGVPPQIISMEIGRIYSVKPGQYHEFHLKRGSVLVGLNSHPHDPGDDYRMEAVA